MWLLDILCWRFSEAGGEPWWGWFAGVELCCRNVSRYKVNIWLINILSGLDHQGWGQDPVVTYPVALMRMNYLDWTTQVGPMPPGVGQWARSSLNSKDNDRTTSSLNDYPGWSHRLMIYDQVTQLGALFSQDSKRRQSISEWSMFEN